MWNRTFSDGCDLICIDNKTTYQLEIGRHYQINSIREIYGLLLYYITPPGGSKSLFGYERDDIFIIQADTMMLCFTPAEQLSDKDLFRLRVAGKL